MTFQLKIEETHLVAATVEEEPKCPWGTDGYTVLLTLDSCSFSPSRIKNSRLVSFFSVSSSYGKG